MDLFNLIIVLTSIQLASSKDSKISFELNMPNFLNSYFGLDETQKTLKGTVVTSGEKHTNLAFDLSMRNKTKYPEGGLGIVQRSNQREPQGPKVDLFKIKMKGIDDALSLAQAVRSFLPTNFSQIAKALNIFEDSTLDHPSLDELVEVNKKRSQKIQEFNFHFPELFGKSRRNGLVPIRPWVELGPGSYKSEIITYPPNFLVKRLKYLVRYAKQQREKEQVYDRMGVD